MSVQSSRSGLFAAAILLLCGWGGAAEAAEGVLLSPARIPPAARAQLAAEIEAARTRAPAHFATLQQVRAELPELDAQKRGRLAPVSRILKALGTDGVLPMLEELAFRAEPRGELTDTAWQAWRLGLLEAVGSLRDARAQPVLTAVLDGPETDFALVKGAAEALGKLGNDRAAAKLVTLSRAAGPKQQAVLAGMGDCRRAKVADELARALARRPADETAALIVRSLGNAGSAWAWETEMISRSGEGGPVRKTAAQALVKAFVHYEGEVREGALDALLVVNDESTPTLIALAKRDAPPELAAELDRLAERFAQSPLRR